MKRSDELVMTAAGGNPHAEAFLKAYVRRAHWVDDLSDGDVAFKKHDHKLLAEMEAEWLLVLSSNPFFLANRAQLVPVMLLGLKAWEDSGLPKWEFMARRDVIKGIWHEAVFCVAWLTGGWARLSDVTRGFREYDGEPQNGGGAVPINGTAEADPFKKFPYGTVR